MYESYAHHFSLEFGIEIPTEKDKMRDAKIKVYNKEKNLILETGFPLKYTPIINDKEISLAEEDKKTLMQKTNEIFERLCFD